jgi:hypothetical protein
MCEGAPAVEEEVAEPAVEEAFAEPPCEVARLWFCDSRPLFSVDESALALSAVWVEAAEWCGSGSPIGGGSERLFG